MDHTSAMNYTGEFFQTSRLHCGSYHELEIDGASSRPQLAGREVAFYSLDIITLSSQILQSSCHRGELQITRGFFTPMVLLLQAGHLYLRFWQSFWDALLDSSPQLVPSYNNLSCSSVSFTWQFWKRDHRTIVH
jgi:hypothetical protein